MTNSTARKAPTSSATKTASTVVQLNATVVTGKAAKEAKQAKAQASEAITVQCLGNAMTHEQIETKALDTVKAIATHAKEGVQNFVELGNLFAASETYFTLIGGRVNGRTQKQYLIKEGKNVVDVLPLEEGKLPSEGSYIQYLNTTSLKEYAITKKRIRSDCKFVAANIGTFNRLELQGDIAKLGLQDIVKLLKDRLKPQGPEITDAVELTIGEGEASEGASEGEASEGASEGEAPVAPELIPAPPTDAAGFAKWVQAYVTTNKILDGFTIEFLAANVNTAVPILKRAVEEMDKIKK